MTRINQAIATLLPAGRLEESLACMQSSLRSGRSPAAPEAAQGAIRENIAVLEGALSPWRPGARRLIHNLEGAGGYDGGPLFPSPDLPLPQPPARDPAIWWGDGYLTASQCAAYIDLFERSELFQGNVISAGKVTVDYGTKYRYEYDVSGNGGTVPPPEWLAVDRALVGVLVKALGEYEARNPILRTMRTPLGDEGWRMIRYTPDNSTQGHVQQHTFHVDGGQEPAGHKPRVLAALVYLNTPEEGGETLFLNQGLAVPPQCGRVIIFPSAFPYVHAGRRVKRGRKYACTLMITL